MRAKKTPTPDPIPRDIAVKLLHELDTLFAHTSRELCHLDLETGAIAECGPQETLLCRLAVIVKAGKIVKLMENSLFAAAAADPHISQPAIARAMNISQQAVSSRKAQLPKPADTDETSETSP